MAVQMGRRAIDFVRYHVNLKPNTKSKGNSYKAPASASKAGGYTMYSREKYPTSATRRNLVEVEDSNEIYGESMSIYDTDYKYFLINK